MKKYRLTEDGVQNTETTAFIPNDERNNDWREYQNWLKGLGPDRDEEEPEDLGTGPNIPGPQFTKEEIELQRIIKVKQAENAVVGANQVLLSMKDLGMDTTQQQANLTKFQGILEELRQPRG